MIVYRDKQRRLTAPSWLDGAPDLARREAADFNYWGIGEAYLCGEQPRADWQDVGDGYAACIVGTLNTERLHREQRWCDITHGPDMQGRRWTIPAPLTLAGERSFRVAYGADYLPKLTDTQRRTEEIARAARGALIAASDDDSGLPMATACAWTAGLLSVTNYVTPAVLGALGLIDDVLVAAVLYGAGGITVSRE